MRSLHEFLTESKKSYSYRVKYAGDFDQHKQDIMKEVFAKFKPESIGEIKKSPIMKSPYDFPNLENEEVSSYDVVLEYPASVDQIMQLAASKGCDVNRLKIMDQRFADSVDAEEGAKAHEGALLDDAELPAQTAEQKAASEEYAKPGEARVNDVKTREYEISGGKTPKAQTTNDLPMGTKSPVGS